MTSDSTGTAAGSGLGEDFLGALDVEAIDGLRPDETSVGLDGVDGDSASGTTAGGHRRPVDGERPIGQSADASVNTAGDDPFDVESGGVFGGGDDDGSRILDTKGIDPIHGVGANKADAVAVSGKIPRQSTGVEHAAERRDSDDPQGELLDVHDVHSREAAVDAAHEFVTPRWLKALAGVLVLVIAAAIAFAVFEPIQVLPRLRLAPGYALQDSSGSSFTSETVRGSVTLYTFSSVECDEDCAAIDDTMRTVRDEVTRSIDLGDTSFRLVTVVLDDSPEPEQLQLVEGRIGADGESWSVIGGDPTTIRNTVGTGFGRYFEVDDDGVRYDPGYVLVDGAGVIRGDYRYQTLADDGDKLVRHIDILASELRYADGSAAVAYEAAHLFLCYP